MPPGALSRYCARRPGWILAGWLAVLAACAALIVSFSGGAISTAVERFDDAESTRAEALLRARGLAGSPQLPNETLIVRSDTLTVDDAAFRAHVEAIAAGLLDLGPEVVAGGTSYYLSGDASLVSADRRATLIPLVLPEPRAGIARVREAVRSIGADPRFTTTSVGRASIGQDYLALAREDLKTEVRIGLPVAAAVLFVVFASVVAALLPVLVALAAIGLALAGTALASQLAPVYFLATNMIVMMGLALGIDYSLFILSRYREERRAGRDMLEAVASAARTASRAVLYSGLTVVLSLAGLLLVPTNVFRSLGAGAIAVTAAAVLAAFTLLPALIGLLGDRIEALRIPLPRLAAPGARFRDAATRLAARWPLASFIVATALLLAVAAPTLSMNTGFAGIETLPERLESRQGFRLLQRDFEYGVISSTHIVVDGDLAAPATQDALRALRAALAADPKFFAGKATLRTDAAGGTAVLSVPMDGDAEDAAVQDAVRKLRQEGIPRAFAGAPARALVTGNAAGYIDFFALTAAYTPRVLAFVLGTSFVLLLVVFRSLAVPLMAIALNLLSVGAAYGLMVLVFQFGVGAHLLGFRPTATIEAWIPLFLFTVLFGLSMDYHVFLLSRMRERFEQVRRNDEAVAFGLERSAGIITGAALIMVAIFAGFASGELVMFQQAGFGLAVAVLLDATLVRVVLVPAAMRLLGERNWALPRWLEWLPRL